MRTMTERLVGEMTLQVFGFTKGQAFAAFRHIVIQDGTAFALHAPRALARQETPPASAPDHQLEPADQALLVFPDQLAPQTLHYRGDLPGIHMEMASGITVQRVEILRQSACL